MGFAVVGSGVPVLLESFSKGDFLIRQGHEFLCAVELFKIALGAAAEPFRQIGAGRIFSGQDTGSARRADMACGIGVIKAHAFLSQAIDVRCFVECASVASDITPTEVIYKKENDVELRFLLSS